MNRFEAIVVGAGPIGLAAIVNLVKKDISCLLLESTTSVGGNIRNWGHVPLFTPWSYDLDELCAIELRKTGWEYPNLSEIPTGDILIKDYLEPLSKLELLKGKIRYTSKVTKISDESSGSGGFSVEINKSEVLHCQYLLDCSGTFSSPYYPLRKDITLPNNNILFNIPNVKQNDALFRNKNIGIVGTGHSALQSVFELINFRKQAEINEIFWFSKGFDKKQIFEKEKKYFKEARHEEIKEALDKIENVVNQGQVHFIYPYQESSFEVSETDNKILYHHNNELLVLDILIINTGYFPDYSFYEHIELSLQEKWKCVLGIFDIIDPDKNTCLSVKEHSFKDLLQPNNNLFVLGQKSYGRAPSFLLKTGYAQIESVVKFINEKNTVLV